jgi:hypothetical protein
MTLATEPPAFLKVCIQTAGRFPVHTSGYQPPAHHSLHASHASLAREPSPCISTYTINPTSSNTSNTTKSQCHHRNQPQVFAHISKIPIPAHPSASLPATLATTSSSPSSNPLKNSAAVARHLSASDWIHYRHGQARLHYPGRARRELHHVYVALAAFPSDVDRALAFPADTRLYPSF